MLFSEYWLQNRGGGALIFDGPKIGGVILRVVVTFHSIGVCVCVCVCVSVCVSVSVWLWLSNIQSG